MNVIQIPYERAQKRLLDKIVAGMPLNPAEKALLRWAATGTPMETLLTPTPAPEPQLRPMENRNREPAA